MVVGVALLRLSCNTRLISEVLFARLIISYYYFFQGVYSPSEYVLEQSNSRKNGKNGHNTNHNQETHTCPMVREYICNIYLTIPPFQIVDLCTEVTDD